MSETKDGPALNQKVVAVNVDLDAYGSDCAAAAREYRPESKLEGSLIAHSRAAGIAKVESCTRLLQTCIERREKVVVIIRTGWVLEALSEACARKEIAHDIMRGADAQSDLLGMAMQFNEADGPQIVLATIAGFNLLDDKLVHADRVIFHDIEWRLGVLERAVARSIASAGGDGVTVSYVMARGTIDETIVDALRAWYAKGPDLREPGKQMDDAQTEVMQRLSREVGRLENHQELDINNAAIAS